MRTGLLLMLMLPAFANAESVLPTPGIGEVAISLGGIILFIILLAWGMRKFSPGSRLSGANGIKIVSAMPVGARDRIVLLEVGGQQLLVGMSPGRMQTLHVLPNPVETEAGSKPAGAFAGKLREAMKRRAQ